MESERITYLSKVLVEKLCSKRYLVSQLNENLEDWVLQRTLVDLELIENDIEYLEKIIPYYIEIERTEDSGNE